MSGKRRTVLVFSLEPWSDLWYSKQHYAGQLGAEHEVYFVGVPDRWRLGDLFSNKVTWRTTPEGVHVADLRNNLPLRLLPERSWRWLARMKARRLLKLVPPEGAIIWCFHPSRTAEELKYARPECRLIYHVVDGNLHDPNDQRFAKASDLVVAVNEWFHRQYRQVNPACMVVPHGSRPEDRNYDRSFVERLKREHGAFMLLAASFTDHVNYALLTKVARSFPSKRLILLGRVFALTPERKRAFERLRALPNVQYEGVKHPDELRNYVHAASVGLVAYDFEPASDIAESAGRTPLKALTYLAQHCPVVATINSWIPVLDGKGYFKTESEEEFIHAVKEVFAGRLKVDAALVDDYMDSVRYDVLVDQILGRLDGTRVALRA